MLKHIEQKKNKVLQNRISTVLKYLFSLALTLCVCMQTKDPCYFWIGVTELGFVFALSNMLSTRYKIGYYINCILMFFYNVQMVVFIFGNSFLTLMMLSNLDSLKALSGNAGIYILGAVITVFVSFLPICSFKIKKKKTLAGAAIVLVVEVFVSLFGFDTYSPAQGYAELIKQYCEKQLIAKEIALMACSTDPVSLYETEFYKEEIIDYRAKDSDLSERPNIILIFTEGLSENVILDERKITPNITKWKNQSINFENYYNHTFATYRGLNGQLYSAHQLDDIENNPLISLQSILADWGYATTFLNTEPENKDFTNYLEGMGFDEVVSDHEVVHNGMADSISDKDAYEMLYQLAEEKLVSEQPFFLSVYTFGTHVSFDGIDIIFGDGKEPVLNRFADMDAQFGAFMDKVHKNSAFDDTIIIFTTDHATYEDEFILSAFPEYLRFFPSFDTIPLFLYHKGIEPENIDANGRNSLNLAPTILDFLDVSAPNFFLGSSLFAKQAGSILESIYYDPAVILSSEYGTMKELEEDTSTSILKIIHKYYVTKALAIDMKNNL